MTDAELRELVALSKEANEPPFTSIADATFIVTAYRVAPALAEELIRLRAEHAMLQTHGGSQQGAYEEELTKLRDENERLRSLIKEAEWADGSGLCNWCGYHVHAEDCAIKEIVK